MMMLFRKYYAKSIIMYVPDGDLLTVMLRYYLKRKRVCRSAGDFDRFFFRLLVAAFFWCNCYFGSA